MKEEKSDKVVKSWYKSKTVWVNGLIILGGILTALGENLATGGAITLIGVANVVLRAVTSSEVKFI